MTNNEIFQKLRLLQSVKPEARWVKNSRADLLLKIKENYQEAEQRSWKNLFVWSKLHFGFLLNLIFPKYFIDSFIRPVAISFVGAMIVFGAMTTIAVSQKALPGNILYPIKIVCENIQLSFSSNIEEKTKLEIEFAGRRIEELNKLVVANKLNSVNLENKIINITSNLQKNIQTVNIHLNELDKTGKADSALKIAKDIDNKVSRYAVVLNKINKSDTVKSRVAEALNQVDEVSDRALEVIITKHKDVGNGISDSEIAEKLNQKIAFTEVDSEKDSKIENQELNQTLQEAKNFIQTGDFAAALNKITEGKDIIKELRAKMELEKEEARKQNKSENVSDEEMLDDGKEAETQKQDNTETQSQGEIKATEQNGEVNDTKL